MTVVFSMIFSKIFRWQAAGAVLLAVLLSGFGGRAMAIETAQYSVVHEYPDFEVRTYPEQLVAQVEVSGTRREAIESGFRLIAAYIFGDNLNAAGTSEKIAMTTPVTQSIALSQNPVASQTVLDDSMTGPWVVRFFMPQQYSLENIPQPTNARVKLINLPAHHVVVHQFSGSYGYSNLNKNLGQLLALCQTHQCDLAHNSITFAFYNGPWMPAFMRRNEVMLHVNGELKSQVDSAT